MSEPVRLLDDPEATSAERSLLRAHRDARAPADARARALTLAAMIGPTGGGGGGARSPGAGAARLSPTTVAAGVAVGIVIGGLTWLAGRPPGSPTGAPTGTHEVSSRPSDAKPDVAPPSEPEPTPVRSIAASELATAPAAPDEHGPRRAPSTAPPADSLYAQIASLDAIRRDLERGQPRDALARLDAHAKAFPSGAFDEEVEVLRFDALRAAGDAAAARKVGEHFLATHPSSTHAARVRLALSSR